MSYVLSVLESSVVVSWLVSSICISSSLVSRLVIECFVGVVSVCCMCTYASGRSLIEVVKVTKQDSYECDIRISPFYQ